MSPHARVLLFCVALLVAPVFYVIGDYFGGDLGGAALPSVVIIAAVIYMQRGQKPRPPTSIKPA